MRSEFIRTLRSKAKDGTLKTVWQDWKWIWQFSRRHRGRVALYTLCGILSSGLALVAGVISKHMIDAIIAMELERMVLYCCCMLGSVVLSVAFQSAVSRFSARLSIDMLTDIQQTVFDAVMQSDWLSLTKYPSGDLLSRFTSDLNTVSSCAVSWLPGVIIQLFTVLATLGVILYYDPVMALIGCASMPVMFLLSRSLLNKQRGFNKQMRQAGGDMAAFQDEAFRNMDTLKSFGVGHIMSDLLRGKQRTYRDTVLEHNRFTIRTNVLLTVMGTVVEYGALAYCLWRLFRGDILFGTVTLFLQQRASLSNAFSSLISLVPTALSGSVAAERIRELTELPKEPHPADTELPQDCYGVELKNVSVGYAPHRPVLTKVSFSVPAGQTLALIGPSGEGKTTLLRLLLGLIPPCEGEISLVDSHGNRHPLSADTRHCFAYVPQGNTVMAGTVAENLRLARQDATDEDLMEALKDACAWEFVSQMPLGIHSPIGEGGKGLSEGQAQRIAIARALVRSAPVLLLDEVTSALDPATEAKVLKNLNARGVTAILTTHRDSVLSQCGQIYRVENTQAVSQLTADS